MFAKQTRIPPLDWQSGLMVAALIALLPLLYVELTGDFPGQALFYGQTEDSPLVDWAFTQRETTVAVFASLWQTVITILTDIQNFFA
jgi:hypothetical protein